MKITINTDTPIAFDSPDHLYPTGAKGDNNTSIGLIEELEARYGKDFSIMDWGCSFGQFIVDCHERGHVAVGLEGASYPPEHSPNWKQYHNKVLFSCDVSRPFTVEADGKPLLFDIITMWEVLEHFPPERLDQVMQNVHKHLKSGGTFIGSIGKYSSPSVEGVELHLSLFPEAHWRDTIMAPYFTYGPYPFVHHTRDDVWNANFSHWFLGTKK